MRLSVHEMESNDQLRALDEDVIDLGFVRPPLRRRDLAVQDLWQALSPKGQVRGGVRALC
ncbi:hypothetical protein [Saccharopolyspora phatthalungensis]|uniref:hypothetical protein n=1 Tax=Saccharopolyspora phatthalungensis TaxID=664693 RepID=UPI000AF2B7F3